MSAGRVSFIGEVDVAHFPHTETIVVVEGKLSLIAADAAPLVLRRGEGAVIARGTALRIQAASRAQFVFCAAAAELANQPGITPLRADANFKPSNSLPAEMLLGPAPQCRSDNVFKDELTGVLAGTWDSTPYHRIVRAHRLNEFMYLLDGSVRFAAPMAACCPPAPAMHSSCRRAHRSAGKAAIAWRSSTCAKPCPPEATTEPQPCPSHCVSSRRRPTCRPVPTSS